MTTDHPATDHAPGMTPAKLRALMATARWPACAWDHDERACTRPGRWRITCAACRNTGVLCGRHFHRLSRAVADPDVQVTCGACDADVTPTTFQWGTL